ncbi:ATP-dependent endonuclease [uncultured Psychrobacter sp.]|uniref:ATP-dependent nuclease n=1 Tax=uncultured Psychrobacter sp. TaxID=259303 RepID=UPI00345ACBBD
MHKIKQLKIRNYRSCQDTTITLENYTPLVGYNNAGKSNILKCIDTLVRGKGQNEASFFDKEKPIEIVALLEGLDQNSLSHLSQQQITSLEPLIEEGSLNVRFFQEKPGTGKNAVLMGVQKPSELELGEWKNPNGLPQAITTLFPEPTFINSMEDSAEDVSKFKASNTIGKLISHLQKEIVTSKAAEINSALNAVGEKLSLTGSERLDELSDFDLSVNEKIEDFFPGLSLNIDIPTPSISDLFKQGTIKVNEYGSERQSDFTDMGHGSQRAIQMTLIRHLAETTKDVDKRGKTNILLIDEPELFLHPQAIELLRSSLKILSTQGYQVVFSTHSPYMIEQLDIPTTNIIRKSDKGTIVTTRLKEALEKSMLDNDSQARLLFDTYNLGQILFSDKVLIAEGDTEKTVLPALFYSVTSKTLGESKLALVVASGANNIPKMIEILNKMGITTKGLVDLDFAFTGAVKQKLIDKNNISIKECLNIIKRIQPIHGFRLKDHLPCGGNNFQASDIYELMAAENDSSMHIKNIKETMKSESIWVWSKGAIEPHLCLKTKKNKDWLKFKQRLSTESIEDCVVDLDEIRGFIEWCTS